MTDRNRLKLLKTLYALTVMTKKYYESGRGDLETNWSRLNTVMGAGRAAR